MYIRSVAVATAIVITWSATSYGEGAECSAIESPQEVIQCALKNDPRVKTSQLDVEEAKGKIEQAGQIPNLEFESDLSYTNNFDSDRYTTDVKLLHTLELGGKRGARLKKANALKGKAEIQDYLNRGNVVIETVISLNRYRQILDELKSVKEILETFSRIERVYKRKSSLSPEQKVSLDVFELAASDQMLIKSKLELELSHLRRDLALSLGTDIQLNETILPKSISNWPDIIASEKIENSPQVKASVEEENVALGEMDIAKSGAWPDVMIGPSIASEVEGNDRVYSYGVSISLPLPLFHQNQGERAVASAQLRKVRIEADTKRKTIKKERDRLEETYLNMVKNLKNMRSHSSLHSKHKKIHTYIKRGIISSALVIESHRQLFEFLQHRNEIELQAIESLWKIYLTDGTILNQTL